MEHASLPIKRVVAIHDLSCFGRAALTVVIPVLSAMGIQVCPLPTALYSTHGLFPGYVSHDLTEPLRQIIRHWKQIGIAFDAIYSGLLNSPTQIDIFSEFMLDFSHERQIVVIDPILGDYGTMYGMVSPDMVERMRAYIRLAHVITPNMTEAALLLGESYHEALPERAMREWLARLADCGPDIVVITSAVSPERGRNQIGVVAYNRKEHTFWQIWSERLPMSFPGTGDLFASVMLGRLLQGHPFATAFQEATQFLARGMSSPGDCGTPEREGLGFEPLLFQLTDMSELH